MSLPLTTALTLKQTLHLNKGILSYWCRQPVKWTYYALRFATGTTEALEFRVPEKDVMATVSGPQSIERPFVVFTMDRGARSRHPQNNCISAMLDDSVIWAGNVLVLAFNKDTTEVTDVMLSEHTIIKNCVLSCAVLSSLTEIAATDSHVEE
ncbi:hypothetical protein C8R44DRAFT_747305 [Mycena epipterygia]|nr:hypothetical protein C8R44DRAFT_747305 [Mycena epipterygia]